MPQNSQVYKDLLVYLKDYKKNLAAAEGLSRRDEGPSRRDSSHDRSSDSLSRYSRENSPGRDRPVSRPHGPPYSKLDGTGARGYSDHPVRGRPDSRDSVTSPSGRAIPQRLLRGMKELADLPKSPQGLLPTSSPLSHDSRKRSGYQSSPGSSGRTSPVGGKRFKTRNDEYKVMLIIKLMLVELLLNKLMLLFIFYSFKKSCNNQNVFVRFESLK